MGKGIKMWIKIIPNDTLFFRSARPFSLGDDTWADSVFPPYPSTIYGALRTFLIFQRGSLKDFKEKSYQDIGTPEKKGSMKVVGPILGKVNDITSFFSVPFDLVNKKGDRENIALPLYMTKKPVLYYSDNLIENIFIFKPVEQVKEIEGYFDDITIKDYLEGKTDELRYIQESEFYTEELKIGISKDKISLTSKEGHLYRIPMLRLNKNDNFPIGFLIKVEDITHVPDRGILQVGAEGKTARFEKVDRDLMENIKNTTLRLKDGIFKLYFATPAIFKNGWLPEWINKETLEGEKDGIKIKLVTAAIGKYIRIGGWDLAKRKPKPMYKAVPAGSVYYFKVLDGSDVQRIKEIFHFKNISDINPEEGFGLSFVGGIQ